VIFDVNTYLGRFPFRAAGCSTPEELAGYLSEGGVEKAVVSNIEAVFHRCPQDANIALSESLRPFRQFVPACVINPKYPGWKQDFLTCAEKLGFRVLELYPYYHGYYLDDPGCLELLDLCAALKMPVLLPCAVENLRQRHHLDTRRNLEIDEVYRALSKAADTDIIIANGDGAGFAKALKPLLNLRGGRVYYDFARLEPFDGSTDTLLADAGENRVVFGSVAPLQYVEPQRVKLSVLNVAPEVREGIASGNLEGLLA
jgi:predicted TIM-barrel fold metal-dependent hydrolase